MQIIVDVPSDLSTDEINLLTLVFKMITDYMALGINPLESMPVIVNLCKVFD